MDIDKIQTDMDGMNAKWVNGEPYLTWAEYNTIRDHMLDMIQSHKYAIKAIVQMAEEMARSLYGIDADKKYWRLFVPETAKRALGWRLHEWHTPDDHDCHDPYCNLCNLSVCKVCGLYEGGLTTECPGERAGHKSNEIYTGNLDFRHGKWVDELSPHRQHCEMHQPWKRNRRR